MDDNDERFIGCFMFAAVMTIIGFVLLLWVISNAIF